jgi:hypothetical protein
LGRVRGLEIASPRGLGDGLQGRWIQIAGLAAEHTEGGLDPQGATADADRVDPHLLGLRNLGGLQRRQLARRVDAVGEQDQDALIGRTLAQALHGQADGIADRGFAPGQPDCRSFPA